MTPKTHQILYGEQVVEFDLRRRARKTLAISVNPDLKVDVVAPLDTPIERILERVHHRTPWVQRQLHFFAQFHPTTPDRIFVSGETHLYLGRQYRLKIIPHVEQKVSLVRGFIVVRSPKPKETDLTKGLVERWYREKARMKFQERLEFCQQRFPRSKDYQPDALILRDLRKRWGSMTRHRKLVLNPALVRSSPYTIDYVITHELCHLRHNDHGPAFYRLLGRVMPDWEQRKIKLERQLA